MPSRAKGDPPPARPAPAEVASFIDELSSAMFESGLARMPSRVFAALLVSESGRLTAAELAGMLQVSPAAVSGAVRYLIQLGMVTRQRETGSRRDHFVLQSDLWYETMLQDGRALKKWEDGFRRGVEMFGTDTVVGDRLTESLDFFSFVRAELPAMMDRWRAQRAQAQTGEARAASPRRASSRRAR